MSFDEYALHIAQKFRLAISIAVIRTKPPNTSLEDHIQLIRENLNRSDDSSISLHSNDFNFDDTEVFGENNENICNTINNILSLDAGDDENTNKYDESDKNKHLDEINDEQNEINDNRSRQPEINDDFNTHLNDNNLNDEINHQSDINDDINDDFNTELNDYNLIDEINHQNDINDVEMIETQDLNASINILANFDENMEDRRNLDDVLSILKSVDDTQMIEKEVTNQLVTRRNENVKQNEQINKDYHSQRIDDTFCDITLIADTDNRRLTQEHNYSINLTRDTGKEDENRENETPFQIATNVSDNKELEIKAIKNNLQEITKETKFIECKTKNDTSQNLHENNTQIERYTERHDIDLTNFTYTHYSATENSIIIIDDKYIHGIKQSNDNQMKINTKNSLTEHIDQKTKQDVTGDNAVTDLNAIQKPMKAKENTIEIVHENSNISYNDYNYSQNSQMLTNSENFNNTQEMLTSSLSCNENFLCSKPQFDDSLFSNYNQNLNDSLFSQGCIDFDKTLRTIEEGSTNFQHRYTKDKNTASFDNIETELSDTNFTNILKQNILKDTQPNSCINIDKTLIQPNRNIDFDEEWTDSQNEYIPFKILEEMNKIKMFLKRRHFDEYSNDTGYRSDSQSKHSLKLSQSPIWLNQSAHSLLSYIMESPLVENVEEITNEISSVLGELIDRLHDEENYPSFLEVLLDSVQKLLKYIYEGKPEENVLLKKDEYIQRLILLNKSKHIQKYTIEKITTILEDLHKHLTNKHTAFEIDNTDKTENICYIFHVLQILLQKYQKTSDNLSQNTQSTQEEERILKKSSISDFWRKKWNPSVKSETNFALETKCPISICGEILNRIIVNCMEGYSLISYFALKCFNILQK